MSITEPGVGYRFLLRVDGFMLGSFIKVEGLSAKYDVKTIKEGGQNTFSHSLPGRVTYTNIKLTRAVDGLSMTLAAWFTAFQTQLQMGGTLGTTGATIVAMNADEFPIAQWSVAGVLPVSYTGPTFQAGSATVLTETLELAHQGFWSEGMGLAPL